MIKQKKKIVPRLSFAIPLLIALALHGVFLFLPTGSEPEVVEEPLDLDEDSTQAFEDFPELEKATEPLDAQIDPEGSQAQIETAPRIATPLEGEAQVNEAPQVPVAQASPAQDYQEYAQRLREYYQRVLAARQRLANQSRSSSPAPAPAPRSSSAQTQTEPTTTAPSPQPSEAAPTVPSPEPVEQTVSARETPAEPDAPSFSQSFPYYSGSWLTSGGVLKPEYRESDYVYYTIDGLEEVAANFESQLSDREFAKTLETDGDDFKVYQVSKDGVTQYLHLVEQDGKTAILLSSDAIELNELENDSQDESIAQDEPTASQSAWLTRLKFYFAFKEQINDNSELQLEPLDFAETEDFPQLKNLQPLDEQNKFLLKNLKAIASPSQSIPPDELAESISQELSEEGNFELEKMDEYSNGDLYRVANGDFEVFMVLMPTQDDEDHRIAVLFSEEDPRSDRTSEESEVRSQETLPD